MSAESTFLVANILFTCGTLLLLMKVMKNRISLHDFDLAGAILTTLALIVMIVGYYELESFSNIVFTIITLLFWAVVSIFSAKNIKWKV